jgi:hypothetical protein
VGGCKEGSDIVWCEQEMYVKVTRTLQLEEVNNVFTQKNDVKDA